MQVFASQYKLKNIVGTYFAFHLFIWHCVLFCAGICLNLFIVHFKAHFYNISCTWDKNIELDWIEFKETPTYVKFDLHKSMQNATLM